MDGNSILKNRGFKGYKSWLLIYDTRIAGSEQAIHARYHAMIMARNLRQAKQKGMDLLLMIKKGQHINEKPLADGEHIMRFRGASYRPTPWIYNYRLWSSQYD